MTTAAEIVAMLRAFANDIEKNLMDVLSYEDEVIDEGLPDDPRHRIAVTIRTSKGDPDTGDPKLDNFIRSARELTKTGAAGQEDADSKGDDVVQNSEILQ